MNEEDFYTASEARKVLGLTEATFFLRVKQGQIPKIIPPGKRQGRYPKKYIDALAQAMHLLFEQQEHIVFSRSNLLEQEEEMQIGIKCFGPEYITPLPERIAFQLKSQYTFWSLKVGGRVVGYVSCFRFTPAFLDDILTGRRIEREISMRDVLPFTRGEPFNVYIDVMATDPQLSPTPRVAHHLRNLYAGIIVSRFIDAILDLRANGYQIENLFTVSATREGDNLIRRVGFRLMEGKSQKTGRIAYEYNLDEAGIERLKARSRREV
jgi:predicted DNA-binding transcriptional regulator AlpA